MAPFLENSRVVMRGHLWLTSYLDPHGGDFWRCAGMRLDAAACGTESIPELQRSKNFVECVCETGGQVNIQIPHFPVTRT